LRARDSSRKSFDHFRRDTSWRKEETARPVATPQPVGDGRRRRYLREYFAWLRPFFRSIAGVLALALASASLSLILPAATMHIIDVVIPNGLMGRLQWLGLGLLAVILVQQTFELLRNYNTAKLNARVLFRLRQRLYDHLLRLPLHELSGMKTGGINSRLSGDVDAVTGMIQFAILTPAVAGAKVIMTVGILLYINWKLAVAATLLLPIIIALNLLYIRRIRPIYGSMRKDRATIDGRVVETFGGIRVVRSFGRERTEARRYGVSHHTVIRKHMWAQILEYVVHTGWGILIPLAGLTIVWFGGTLVLMKQGTIGGIMAFQMYMMMLLMPVSAIVQSFGQMQQALAALERIFDVLRVPLDKPDRPGARPAPPRVEQIEFDGVWFAYPSSADSSLAGGANGDEQKLLPPVLSDVSIRVPGGSTVALVGPSGSGKTTLTNLVARFYDPTRGAVRLNGVDLRDYQLRSFRSLLGIVQQDVFLFDGTIAENIAYGRKNATLPEIIDAARRANAHEFISTFSAGYETVVGERGVRLSGGQAQRVSIARAILADPRILILDEATSNLDSESEQLIQASLAELLADRTTFVIAHRLSTVVNADMIVVLINGAVAEVGTHEELMAAGGPYRAMVERQQRGLSEDLAATEWSVE